MNPSPGQQPSEAGVDGRRVLILLLPALAVFWLWNTRYPPIREHRQYLTQDRKDAVLPWRDLSEAWTEADVRARFQGFPTVCTPDETGAPGITRMCSVHMRSLNGVPTMNTNFLFAGPALRRVATSVPWWSHRKGIESLVTSFGRPHVSQSRPVAGIRLHGWKLPGGASLFYKRDRGPNPLETSSTQWLAASACTPSPCIH